jgi:PAS domain S-box-containing protein
MNILNLARFRNIRYYTIVVCILLLQMIPSSISAQRYPLRVYNVKEGMSQSQINDIVQDKEGYLWFACAEGLTRFDGHNFKTFDKSNGLAGSLIMSLMRDKSGDLWLGYRDNGVSKYLVREKKFIPVDLPDAFRNSDAIDIIELNDGSVLIATDDDGLLLYQSGDWRIINEENGLETSNITSVCAIESHVWVGTEKDLYTVNLKNLKVDTLSLNPKFSQLKGMGISALLGDGNKNVWIGTKGSDLFCYLTDFSHNRSDSLLNVSIKLELPKITANCLMEDGQQNIWIGTTDKGIIYLNKEFFFHDSQYHVINEQNGLIPENITVLFQDHEGSYWFGTNGRGVYQYRSNCFEMYGELEGLIDDVVWAVFEDSSGGFWFGTENGLTHVKNGKGWRDFNYYSSNQWQGNNSVLDIDRDSEGNIWLVVLNSGVRIFNPKTNQFNKVPELENQKIISIEKGHRNDFWFGSFDHGVFRLDLDTGKIINYKASDGIGSDTIYDIISSPDGEIWFATNNAGITKYDYSSFINYGDNYDFGGKSVLSLARNSQGIIWVGTEGEGLYRFDGIKFENFSNKFGLWKGDIYTIICDDSDNVFLGTRRGIEKFDPGNNKLKKYGKIEGFADVETNQNSAYKDSAGRLWFGTINGAVRYNSAVEKPNRIPPNTYIDDIRIFMQDKPLPADNIFSHTDNHFTFYFSGLSFVAPENMRFTYQLEGLDRDWLPLSSENKATYANIPPGDYIFKVKSLNNDGVWSKQYASYRFSISAPFWQQSWFYVLMVCALATSFYGIHRRRVQKISRNNMLLEEMVHSRTSALLAEKEKAQDAVKALKDSEQKLIRVTESINAYLWSLGLNTEGKFDSTFITETFFNIIGYEAREFPPAENKFEQFLKIVHKDDREYIRKSLRKAVNGETINLNFRIITPDGTTHWHYVHAFPESNKDGKVELIHGVGFDITHRKLAEEALRKSEEKYATFMRYSTEAIWCIDMREPIAVNLSTREQIDRIIRDAYLSDCNDAMANLYGYNSAIEIIGIPMSAGLLSDVPQNREHLEQFIESGYRLKNAEFREIDNNGKVKIMLVGFVGILEKGFLVRAWGMQRDITEQRQAEDALIESEEMYRRLIERSPDAIIVHSKGKIDYINKAGIKLYGGSTVSQFLGHKLTEFSHPDFRELGQMRVRQIYQEKKEVGLMEQKMIRIDGTEFDVEVMGAPIIYKGRASGQSIVRDITERKRLENEIQKSQKLESVGILAGGIAHDFNNILTAILGNISLGKMYTNSHDETHSVLTEAEKATLQAKDLTQQLLTFSKGGAPVKETTSIFEIIKESTNFILRGSNIDAEYICPDDLWSVDVDAAQISQVIQNLVINAEQAMPNGKKISIKLSNRILKQPPHPNIHPGKFVEIGIVDKGIGIPEEHLNKIFDPYFTTKQKGSGLGLATSYSIINRHGGHINIDSVMGQGTEVRIFLPASDKIIEVKQPGDDKVLSGNGKILVMDDEEMLLQLTSQFLNHLGYQVSTVSDGESAIEAYKKASQEGAPFSVVIMDLTIPGGMGGKETIKKLRQFDPHIRAIVSSGYSNDPVMADFQKYGFQAVLTKPYKIQTLSAVIDDVVKHQLN